MIFVRVFFLLLRSNFMNAFRMPISLDPDEAQHFAGPELGQNCLQRLSADDRSPLAIKEWKGWRYHSKTCVKRPLSKRPKIGFQDQLSLNAGQKYCRMLQVENSAILSTFIKLPFVIKIFVLFIFEWPFYTGFTVITCMIGFILYSTMSSIHNTLNI